VIRVLVLSVVFATVVVASDPPPFRWAQPVVPGGSGPNRLVLDVPVLTGARPLRFDATGRFLSGLEDLRLTNGDGTEVPYLLLAPPVVQASWWSGRLQPIPATDDASGFELDLGQLERADRLRLSGLPGPFLKRGRIEASGDRTHWVVLAEQTTVFDLPDEGLRRLEVAFDPTPLRYVRVTWDDRSSGRLPLPAAANVRSAAAALPAPPPAVLVPVAFERRPSEPGTSRFRIVLPGTGLPIRAFELDVGGDHLTRSARISEPQLAGETVAPRELGAAALRRVTRDGLAASDLRIPVATPREMSIELVVDDGDNPPLELQAVRAELPPLPVVYFESPDGAALTAKYGVADLAAPRYDLEAARETLARGTTPAAAATWGGRAPLEVPPPPEPPPAEAGVPTAGATIDRSVFHWIREIPPGPGGLTSLRLDAAVLAHSDGLGDVRLIDGEGRQIPYVVEQVGEPLVVALEPPSRPAEPDDDERVTTHRLSLPYRRLPQARLVLETNDRVFDRHVVVRGDLRFRPSGDERDRRRVRERRREDPFERVATVAWRHADPARDAPAITIDLPPLQGMTVLIDVDDGDNQPLAITSARLLLPTRRLRFVRIPDTQPVLAYGAIGLGSPRYDISLLAPRIVGAPAHEIDPLPEAAGAAEGSDESDLVLAPEHDHRLMFWAVLGVSVVALLAILGRLLRVEGAGA
jgi:hypothetical protein